MRSRRRRSTRSPTLLNAVRPSRTWPPPTLRPARPHREDYQSAINDAAAAADKVPDLAPWANARLQVIQARVRANDYDGANAAVKAMDDRTQAEADTIIAVGYAQGNQQDLAKQTVQKLIEIAPTCRNPFAR